VLGRELIYSNVDISKPGTVPTQAKIRQYLAAIEKLTMLLQKFEDVESVAKLEQCCERLGGLLEGLGMDGKGDNIKCTLSDQHTPTLLMHWGRLCSCSSTGFSPSGIRGMHRPPPQFAVGSHL
jgi:hypothetical protein